jgi:hypothetical protein
MNLFEIATRNKFRFASVKGELNVEQLWELKLTERNSFDLDNVARAVADELKAITETSFVKTNQNPKQAILEAKLELVKYIIQVKQEEIAAATQRAHRTEEARKLRELLANKKDAALQELTTEEIQARLKELGE